MPAQGEKVGALYVDVGADLSQLNTLLDAAEKRLTALSSKTYQFSIGATQSRGGAKDPIAVLQKQLNSAQLTVPIAMKLAPGAVAALKQAILTGMAGFVVPVQVSVSGMGTGQTIKVDGEIGTVVPGGARSRQSTGTATGSRAATAAATDDAARKAKAEAQQMTRLEKQRQAEHERAGQVLLKDQMRPLSGPSNLRDATSFGRLSPSQIAVNRLNQQRVASIAGEETFPGRPTFALSGTYSPMRERALEKLLGMTGEYPDLGRARGFIGQLRRSRRAVLGNAAVRKFYRLQDKPYGGLGEEEMPPMDQQLLLAQAASRQLDYLTQGRTGPLSKRSRQMQKGGVIPEAIDRVMRAYERSLVVRPAGLEKARTFREETITPLTPPEGQPWSDPEKDPRVKITFNEQVETPEQKAEREARNEAKIAKFDAKKNRALSRRRMTSMLVKELGAAGISITRAQAAELLPPIRRKPKQAAAGEAETAATQARGEANIPTAPEGYTASHGQALIRQFRGQSLKTVEAEWGPTNAGWLKYARRTERQARGADAKAAEPITPIETAAAGDGGRGRARGAGRGGVPGVPGGGVQKVFVVNWPASFAAAGGGPKMAESYEKLVASMREAGATEEEVAKFTGAPGGRAPGGGTAPKGKAAKRIRYPFPGTREDASAVGYRGYDPDRPPFGRVAAREKDVLLGVQSGIKDVRGAFREAKGDIGDVLSLISARTAYDKTTAPKVTPEANLPLARQIALAAAAQGVEPAKVPIRRAAGGQTPEERAATALQRAEITGQKAGLPERAASTATAQIIARATGTKARFEAAVQEETVQRAILKEYKDDLDLVTRMVAAHEHNYGVLQKQRDVLQAQGKSTTDIEGDLQSQADLLGKAREEQTALTAKTTEQEQKTAGATRAREKAGGGLASLAQVGALFLGVKAFLLINQAFEAAVGAVGAALAPIVEGFTGFAETSKKVTGALRDQTMANKGNVDASIAAAGAQAGLSASTADFLKVTGLGGAVTAQAGAKAAMQTRDLFYSTIGMGYPGGFNPALARGTGGVLNTQFLAEQMGGQAGLAESLARQQGTLGERAGLTRREGLTRMGASLPDPRALAEFHQGIANANDALDRQAKFVGASSSAFEIIAKDAKDFDAAAKAMHDSAYAISDDFGNVADQLIRSGTVFAKAGGGGLAGTSFGVALQQYAQGLTIQDPTLLIKEQARTFNASLQASDLKRELQQRTLIPGQLAIQLAGHPLLAPSAGIIPPGMSPEDLRPPGSTALGPNVREITSGLLRVGELQAQLQVEADKGLAALEDMVARSDAFREKAYTQATFGGGTHQAMIDAQAYRPAGFEPQLPRFQSLYKDLQGYGEELKGIQEALANRQALNAAQDYTQQIILTVRNLNDARALAGQRTQQDNLGIGALERQNILLQRQSQELGFQSQELQLQLQQRQLNFQVAVAGFTAPGLTSEERRARIEQAKLEAAYQQQLLDIQKKQFQLGKKQFGISVQIQDRTFLRQVQELEFQLNSLERGRSLTLYTADAQKQIAGLEALIGNTTAQLNAILEQSSAINLQIIEVGQAVAAATGAAVQKVVDAVVRELSVAVRDFIHLRDQIRGPSITQPTYGGDRIYEPPPPTGGAASGMVGLTTGRTSAIFGEAGTEGVAIIRNPRPMSLNGMGNGINLTVIVTGNSINNDQDVDVMATKIARKVEDIFNRRGSLVGLRNLTS